MPRDLLFSDSMLNKARAAYISGVPLTSLGPHLGLQQATVNRWYASNYNGFKTKVLSWRAERLFEKALGNIEDVLGYETTQNSQPHLLKLKYDASVFVAETIGSALFTKSASSLKPASGGSIEALELSPEQQMRIAQELLNYPASKKEDSVIQEEKKEVALIGEVI